MKRFMTVLIVLSLAISGFNCKKATEDVVDCTASALTAGMHADLDATNSKLMHFQFYITVADGLTLDHELQWNFGNGVTQTADTLVSYEYPESGTYEASATYTLRNSTGSCSSTTTKHIVIP